MHILATIGVLLAMTIAMPSRIGSAEEDTATPADKKTACRLPNIDEISSIVAESYCHPFLLPDVPGFPVPKEKYAELLKHFEDSEYHGKGTASLILVKLAHYVSILRVAVASDSAGTSSRTRQSCTFLLPVAGTFM